MNKDRIEAWVSALESGEYTQVTHSLREPIYDKDDKVTGVGYCALGVGQLVAQQRGVEVNDVDWFPGRMTFEVMDWYGLDQPDPRVGDRVPCTCGEVGCREEYAPLHVSDLNDTGTSFWDIAQMLRTKYLKEES